MKPIEEADRFLAACVRQTLAAGEWPIWPKSLASPDDCQTVLERAEFHGISVLLASDPVALSRWPNAIGEQIRDEARLAGLWEEIHRRTIAKLVEELTENGIESVVMKGTALAYLCYNDPATRRRGDTDLLIGPDNLSDARTILARLGYERREDPYGLFYQETWLIDYGADMIHAVDLHWQPADRPMLQRVLKGEEFRTDTRPLPRLSPHAQAPDAVLMLVHGALNQAWHVARGFLVDDKRITGGRRLIWSVDYCKLTADFSEDDWRQLAEFCDNRDAATIVHTALNGAIQDLSLEVPSDVMNRLDQAGTASPTHRYIARADTLSDLVADFGAAESFGTKMRLLMSGAFAPRHHLLEKYPQHSSWPTFALQVRRYADMIFRPRDKKASQ